MNDFFKFYSGSLSGTIIVIIIFLFIRFLLRKQSNYIKIMLWVILLIRLLFPVSIYTEYGILYSETFATVYKGNIIKNLIMDCQSYTKYRPNETTGGIFVSWRRKEELPTGA